MIHAAKLYPRLTLYPRQHLQCRQALDLGEACSFCTNGHLGTASPALRSDYHSNSLLTSAVPAQCLPFCCPLCPLRPLPAQLCSSHLAAGLGLPPWNSFQVPKGPQWFVLFLKNFPLCAAGSSSLSSLSPVLRCKVSSTMFVA